MYNKPLHGLKVSCEVTSNVLQEGILRSFRVYMVNRACPGRMVM